MTPTECVKLCQWIAARCPAMRLQDSTPDAWYVDLVDIDFEDALEAARTVTLNQTFIGIGDLVTECRQIIRRRAAALATAERDAQIAAENGGVLAFRTVPAITAGQTIPSAANLMRQEVARNRKPAAAIDTAATQAERERREQARAELDRLRGQQDTA